MRNDGGNKKPTRPKCERQRRRPYAPDRPKPL